jgi:tRNA(Arg) A34 adenosine deaminase TadA
MPTDDVRYMRMAVEVAREGVLKGQTPFGAVIVRRGEVLAREHNQVWETRDITAHAEMVAIREACRRLETIDLSGCTLFSTCEPCPMCFGAIHWARVSRVVYGCRIKDAKRLGFSELTVSVKRLKSLGNSRIKVKGGMLREECLGVMEFWKGLGGRAY